MAGEDFTRFSFLVLLLLWVVDALMMLPKPSAETAAEMAAGAVWTP